MGYWTDVNGELSFNKPVEEDFRTYLNKFYGIRHVLRDNDRIMANNSNWKDLCYNGNLGEYGEYFVGNGEYDQDEDSIIDVNHSGVFPALNCMWYVSDDGTKLLEDAEKPYGLLSSLIYIIRNFLEPNGYVLNGELEYIGGGDRGKIKVADNKVTYSGPLIVERYWDSAFPFVYDKYQPEQEGIFDTPPTGFSFSEGIGFISSFSVLSCLSFSFSIGVIKSYSSIFSG